MITKDDIENYIRKATNREPRILIDLLIKEVIIYNDRRGFTFYTCKKTIIIDQHKLGRKPLTVTFTIELSF